MHDVCETVIARICADPQFRQAFEVDRGAALREFALTGEERTALLALDVRALDPDSLPRRQAASLCAMKGGRRD